MMHTSTRETSASPAVLSSDWKKSLPVLVGRQVALRELRLSDAPSLFAMLSAEEVARFISPPPSTVDGFEQFITWTLMQQAAGATACFAVTLHDDDTAIGIFQVRQLAPGFETAEWGFAVGSPYWGTGVFLDSASLMLDFIFETLCVRRLEARVVVQNGRGNGAMAKVGAVQEGLLRKSFVRNGRELDQLLYSILNVDWEARRLGSRSVRHFQVH